METDDEPKKDFKALDADDIALLKAYVRVILVAIFCWIILLSVIPQN